MAYERSIPKYFLSLDMFYGMNKSFVALKEIECILYEMCKIYCNEINYKNTQQLKFISKNDLFYTMIQKLHVLVINKKDIYQFHLTSITSSLPNIH